MPRPDPKKFQRGKDFPTCFVLMPFTGEFQSIYQNVIDPAIRQVGYRGLRVDSVSTGGLILPNIVKVIVEADLVIADLTGRNPNVLYELAVAHTLRKRVIMITQDFEDIPFDLSAYRIIGYRPTIDGAQQLREELTRAIVSSERDESHSLNPINAVIPEMPSASELRSLRSKLGRAQAKLAGCEEKNQRLEAEMAGQARSDLRPEDVVRELTSNQAIRELHKEIADKDRQIRELASQPAAANVEREKLQAENLQLLTALQRMRSFLPVRPHWGIPSEATNPTYVFVLMPYHAEWSDIVWEVIRSCVTAKGLLCERADDKTGKFVMHDIWTGINTATLVIADLTDGNPNVAYEVGMCDVLGKNQILLAQDPKKVPFDFLGVRLIPYSYVHGGIKTLKADLAAAIDQIITPSGTSARTRV